MRSVQEQLDHDRLNSLLNADPELAKNMLEQGYVSRQPVFDHNRVLTSEYFLTEEGRKEFARRDLLMAMFADGHNGDERG